VKKEKIIRALNSYGDEVEVNSFFERLFLLEKLEAGEAQISAGGTATHEAVKERLGKRLDL
jgi:hypothetical protein